MGGRKQTGGRKQAPATPLTRERIVATALELVDREGPAALSMRRLGAELGVDPMAVYYHVPNKAALLDAIVEAVMAKIDLTDDRSAPVEERILRAASSTGTPCSRTPARCPSSSRAAPPLRPPCGPWRCCSPCSPTQGCLPRRPWQA